MQSLPSERDPNDVYRISEIRVADEKPLYVVVGFRKGSETPYNEDRFYRFDMLPQWMQDAIAVLDTAGPRIGVSGLGRKIGSSYWIGEGLDRDLFES